jgi:prephenate dehydrogenase
MELLVIGAGVMGRWLGRTLEPIASVTYLDRDRRRAEEAAAAGAATATTTGQSTDVVAIAVPISATEAAIATYAPLAREGVFDVTGRMQEPLSAMRDVTDAHERMSLHPLFAPRAAPGRIATAVDVDGPYMTAIRERLQTVGNEVVTIEPETHDQAMRTVQGAAHAAIFAYGLAAEPVPPELHTPVSATLEQLLERVTHGDPGVYREIQDSFDGTEALAAAARRMAADPSAFEALYDPLDTGG